MKSILLAVCAIPLTILAQPLPVVNTFPSLSIGTHSRGLGMGNTGIASSVENQVIGYNIARAAFTQHFNQASFTYLPWLRSVSDDSRFLHADYLHTAGNHAAFGFAINFLDLGNVAIRDNTGATLGLYKSNEFNLGISYALQLGANASIGTTMRLIGSRYYTLGMQNNYSVCGDLAYYQFAAINSDCKLGWGATLSNLGAAVNLPLNAGVGLGITKHIDHDQFEFTVDASRLIKDDWKGVRIGCGAEYVFDETLVIRCGANLENKEKGNRKYFSFGAGYKGFVSDQSWGVDVHYLVPFGSMAGISPFQNQYGLTLKLNIGNFQ